MTQYKIKWLKQGMALSLQALSRAGNNRMLILHKPEGFPQAGMDFMALNTAI